MNIRAWSIVEYRNDPCVILTFDHNNYTVSLSRWLHPIKVEFIRNIAYKLKEEIRISLKELNDCKILFMW